jgi:hypothetical protein
MLRNGAPRALDRDLRRHGWTLEQLRETFSRTSLTIKENDCSRDALHRVQDDLSSLYVLAERLITEETDQSAAQVQIALSDVEDDRVEYKSSMRVNLATQQVDKRMDFEVVKAIAGLANHLGGTLYIGVNDTGEILGLDSDLSTFKRGRNREDQFRRHFDEVVSSYLGVANYQIVKPKWVRSGGKNVWVVEVEAGARPTFVKTNEGGDFYLRRGARTVKLPTQQFYEYYTARWPTESSSGTGRPELP